MLAHSSIYLTRIINTSERLDLVILGEDEVNQILVAARSRLDSKYLRNRRSIRRLKLHIVLLNPGCVKQKLLVARGTIGGGVADRYPCVDAAFPNMDSVTALSDWVAIQVENLTCKTHPALCSRR